MIDALSAAKLTAVHPLLAQKVLQVLTQLELLGINCRVTQGLRTIAEQNALYAQGRTTPGRVVTNCQGGFSYHNYGLAVDCVPAIAGIDVTYSPDWNPSHPDWKKMEAAAAANGLDCGANWRSFPDYPHMQLTGPYPEGEPDSKLREVFQNGGMSAVWDAVTAFYQ